MNPTDEQRALQAFYEKVQRMKSFSMFMSGVAAALTYAFIHPLLNPETHTDYFNRFFEVLGLYYFLLTMSRLLLGKKISYLA